MRWYFATHFAAVADRCHGPYGSYRSYRSHESHGSHRSFLTARACKRPRKCAAKKKLSVAGVYPRRVG